MLPHIAKWARGEIESWPARMPWMAHGQRRFCEIIEPIKM
jgi:hypothetical protein